MIAHDRLTKLNEWSRDSSWSSTVTAVAQAQPYGTHVTTPTKKGRYLREECFFLENRSTLRYQINGEGLRTWITTLSTDGQPCHSSFVRPRAGSALRVKVSTRG